MNRNKRVILFLAYVACCYSFSNDAWGQNAKREVAVGQISVEVLPLISRARMGAPLPIDFRIFNNSGKLLTGKLVIEAKEELNLIYNHELEMTLTKGEQTFHHLLPVQFYSPYSGQIDLQLYFETDSARYDLDFHPVQLPQLFTHNLSVGFCVPQVDSFLSQTDRKKNRENVLKDWLNFNDFTAEMPENLNDPVMPKSRSTIVTIFSQFERVSLPQHPLEFTCFDILVLWEESFAELNSKQLSALEQWIQAGGNTVIFTGPSLDDEHLKTLNRIAGSPTEDPYFYHTPDNELAWNPEHLKDQHFVQHQYELGRVLVLDEQVLENFHKFEEEKKQAHLFLWNYRNSTAKQQLENKVVDLNALVSRKEKDRFGNPKTLQEINRLQQVIRSGNASPKQGHITRSLVNEELMYSKSNEPFLDSEEHWIALLPTGFQIVPPSVIRNILIGYLLLIGPVDFFFLGFIKKRKWTWVTFPLLTIFVTVFTVYLVNSYMEIQNPAREIRVVDIGSQGQVLRTNSINCLMSSAHRTERTEAQQELVSPIPTAYQVPIRQASFSSAPQLITPPFFTGSLTGKSSLTQPLNKWSPVVRVKFSIPNKADSQESEEASLSGFPWQDITLENLQAENSTTYLVEQLKHCREPQSQLILLKGEEMKRLTTMPDNVARNWQRVFSKRSALTRILNHTAPRPGKLQENLSLFDAYNSDDYCLVLIHQNESQTFVERRVFHAKDNQ